MKKVKWIMLAVVLCLGLVGGAYAYWTDTVYVEGTVATGDFDVVIGAPSNYPNSWGGGDLDYATGDEAPYRYERWVTAPSSDNTTVSFEVSHLYPRNSPYEELEDEDYLRVLISFKNDGTVPVALNSVTAGGSPALLGKLRVAFHLLGADDTGGDEVSYEEYLDEIETIMLNIDRLQRIEPGDTEYIAFAVYLDKDVTDFQDATRTVTLEFDWKQVNAP